MKFVVSSGNTQSNETVEATSPSHAARMVYSARATSPKPLEEGARLTAWTLGWGGSFGRPQHFVVRGGQVISKTKASKLDLEEERAVRKQQQQAAWKAEKERLAAMPETKKKLLDFLARAVSEASGFVSMADSFHNTLFDMQHEVHQGRNGDANEVTEQFIKLQLMMDNLKAMVKVALDMSKEP